MTRLFSSLIIVTMTVDDTPDTPDKLAQFTRKRTRKFIKAHFRQLDTQLIQDKFVHNLFSYWLSLILIVSHVHRPSVVVKGLCSHLVTIDENVVVFKYNSVQLNCRSSPSLVPHLSLVSCSLFVWIRKHTQKS